MFSLSFCCGMWYSLSSHLGLTPTCWLFVCCVMECVCGGDELTQIDAAKNFTNHLYAKGSGARKRRWDSDGMRFALKKQFLDLISSVLCHHRVLDYIFLGIANRRLEQLKVAQAPPIPAAMPMGEVGGSILLAVR